MEMEFEESIYTSYEDLIVDAMDYEIENMEA